MKTAELALALIGTGLQTVLCLLLLFRQRYKEFPIFFVFTAFSVISTLTGLAVSGMPQLYFYVYWISEVFYVSLSFFTLNEVFRSVFRNFYGMLWFRLLFPVIGISMLAVAVIRTILLPRPAHSTLTVTVIALEIGVGLLQFAMFAVFILLTRFFRMHWRQHAFGVVLGFGIGEAGNLIGYLLRSEFGKRFDPIVRMTVPIAYIIGVVVWVITFLRPDSIQPALGGVVLSPEQMVSDLKRYTRAVKGILER